MLSRSDREPRRQPRGSRRCRLAGDQSSVEAVDSRRSRLRHLLHSLDDPVQFQTRERRTVRTTADGPGGDCTSSTCPRSSAIPNGCGRPSSTGSTSPPPASTTVKRNSPSIPPTCANEKTPQECAAYDPSVDSPADFRCCPNLKLYPSASGHPRRPPTRFPTRSRASPTRPCQRFFRPTATGHYVNAITKFFGADNVWKNYFLVSAQWPLRGSATNYPFYAPSHEADLPCLLRNATLETFSVGLGASRPQKRLHDRSDQPVCLPKLQRRLRRPERGGDTPCPGGEDALDQFNTATCIGFLARMRRNDSSFIFSHRPCCVRSDAEYPQHLRLVARAGRLRSGRQLYVGLLGPFVRVMGRAHPVPTLGRRRGIEICGRGRGWRASRS